MNLPTQLTVLRIILTPFFVYTLFLDHLIFKYISFVIFTVASLTDLYDGYYAKKYGYVTKWGKFLDPLADKILVSAALIAFYILDYIHLWVVIVIVTRDFFITGLRSYALYREKPVVTREYARWKTFMQMTAVFIVYIFLLVDYQARYLEQNYVVVEFLRKINFTNKLMAFIALLTLVTGVLYFIENRSQIKTLFISFYKIFIPSE
ncbi:CDP-diacylglycerol--glycerol-3-phosphate 3-phosphatidyltransferase [candidate division KSB1 bacterium]|nr:CDP-diacylglycerol--glycerol-3-phosphate 3-phosphatidyltransferase [candidate division KSB1 bacterium]